MKQFKKLFKQVRISSDDIVMWWTYELVKKQEMYVRCDLVKLLFAVYIGVTVIICVWRWNIFVVAHDTSCIY